MESNEGNFLDRMIAKRAVRNPEFPAMVEAAHKRHASARERAAKRALLGVSAEVVRINPYKVIPVGIARERYTLERSLKRSNSR
jgi:hypothetical protein